jgi:hypothetical protein
MHFPFGCAQIEEYQAQFAGWDITWADSPWGATAQGNVFAGVPVDSTRYMALVVACAVEGALAKLAMV